MTIHIKDTVAIVTGGASGLGEATVRRLVSNGGKAVILDLSAEKGKQLSRELGENTLYIQTDITDELQVEAALQQVSETFGSISVLINCAGILHAEKTFSKNGAHSLATFQKVMMVNVIGTFNVIRLTVEKMAQDCIHDHGERGVIINTSSITAFEGQIGQVAYSTSKAAVMGMTLPMARDLASLGVRVMTIAPGLFQTNMFDPQGEVRQILETHIPFPSRLGLPTEYAQLVQSIIENPMLNGETIRLDGAIRMPPKF